MIVNAVVCLGVGVDEIELATKVNWRVGHTK